MKRRRMVGLAVVFGVAVTVMTVVALEGPGWAAPSQSSIRQTVPEPLPPRAYLPIVVSESVTVAEGGTSVPATSATEVTYPGPGVMLPDTLTTSSGGSSGLVSLEVDGPNVRTQSAVESKDESRETGVAAADDLPAELCRLGVDGSNRIDNYSSEDLAALRVGWYLNWRTSSNPPTPDGIEFAQSVFVKQWKWKDGELVLYDADAPYAEPYTYTVRPSISTIKEIAAANPGSLWLIGNEIERRDWPSSDGGSAGQQEILPEVYARAYHEVYEAIKHADPTARVANGSIIVPTPLRLEYMTRVWNEYLRVYGTPMPVDVWQIHVYLGPEKRGGWGIDVPAGIDADVGMFYFDGDQEKCVLVNKEFSYVPDLVRDFRAWMKERGQQNKPLMVTEFGVSMPDWVMEGEFTPEKIRDEYMYPSLDFLLNATDPELGYPADGNRLVQSAWWWSLDADGGEYEGDTFYQYFNGNLFWSGIGYPTHSPHEMGIAPLGEYWTDYTSSLAETVNLRPLRIVAEPVPFSADGDPVTATLRVRVSNSGNVAVTEPFSVTVHDRTGVIVGGFTVDTLAGCGSVAEGVVTWPDLSPGSHPVTVRVDPSNEIPETEEADNEMSSRVLVATSQVHLPAVLRGGR